MPRRWKPLCQGTAQVDEWGHAAVWPCIGVKPQAKVAAGHCDLVPGCYLKLARQHQPRCRTSLMDQMAGWWVPGILGMALMGWQVWQTYAYTANSTGRGMKKHWNLTLQVYKTGWIIQYLTTAKTKVSHSLHFSFPSHHFSATLCLFWCSSNLSSPGADSAH